jgi:L-asparaginase
MIRFVIRTLLRKGIIKRLFVGFAFLLASIPFVLAEVIVIDFGGTIAGVAEAPNSRHYISGDTTIRGIVETLKTRIRQHDPKGTLPKALLNVRVDDSTETGPSSQLTPLDWSRLGKQVQNYLDQEDVDGVVITHGTDTLEETAFFLHLTVKSGKPVVFVGAMRASNQLGSDGQLNLYNGIVLAGSNDARNRGVMVVLNDEIHSARDVTKSHTTNLDTFDSPNSGPLGHIYFGKMHFVRRELRPHTIRTPFTFSGLIEGDSDSDTVKLRSRVHIEYHYAGNSGAGLAAAINRGEKGVVLAGSGSGAIGGGIWKTMEEMCESEKLPIIVRASRTGSGSVGPSRRDDQLCRPLIPSGDLNPQKARILLLLALAHEVNDPTELRKVFEQY